jgi:hypothetical protein
MPVEVARKLAVFTEALATLCGVAGGVKVNAKREGVMV